MTLLIYGIMAAKDGKPPAALSGVASQPVETTPHDGLQAAHSALPGTAPPMILEEIRTFNAVVQALCRHATTIPLRYGSLRSNIRDMTAHLSTHKARYHELLRRIDGCVEMGIRMERPELRMGLSQETAQKNSPHRALSGRHYLRHRRDHYAAVDETKTTAHTITSTYVKAFEGLYKTFTYEIGPPAMTRGEVEPPRHDLSLYFLVPVRHTAAFTSTFRDVQQASGHRQTLSGPWPPYNFVTQERTAPWTSVMPNRE